MPPATRSLRIVRLAACTFAAALTISGCGLDLDPDPTPTAAPTEVTFGPDDIAVGELLDRSEEAWEGIDGWSTETRTEQPNASQSGGASAVTTEDVLLPSTRRVLSTNEETIVSEEIAIYGMIYMRGTLVTTSIYPDVDADTWIMFSPEEVPADTPLAQRVQYLTSAPDFPFSDVTAGTRGLPANPVGEVQVEGRDCSVYQFMASGASSGGITYRLAFDANWLPCQLILEGGGIVEMTTWSLDSSAIEITAPIDAVPIDTFPAIS